MFQKLVPAISLGIIVAIAPNVIADNSPKNANYLSYKSNKKAIDVGKISIGGIKLGMKEKDIVKKFGKPKSRTIRYDDVCHSSYITTWKYNGLEIEGLSTTNNPSQSQVHLITTSSSLYPTEQGIKVGDNVSKPQKLYSNLLSKIERAKDLDYLTYSNDAYGGLVFYFNNQRSIKKIILLAASC